MTKRSETTRPRSPRDFYATRDPAAVRPLLRMLDGPGKFIEPCAGDGALLDQLVAAGGTCVGAFDIEPQRADIFPADTIGMDFTALGATRIITNPPWTRDILHAVIEAWAPQMPTWLLFDADWVHTAQSAPYMPFLREIVSVGRVSWMNNGTVGYDNVAWHLFHTAHNEPTKFFGRNHDHQPRP